MKSFVTDRERELVLALVIGKIDEHAFLVTFGEDPADRAAEWLQRSASDRDALAAELALHLGHRFGFKETCLPWLESLAVADCHQSHEDVVEALSKLAAPRSVDVLSRTAEARFPYREYDESRSLGVKCIRALGRIGTVDAVARLRELVRSDDPILAEQSARMLQQLAIESESNAVGDAAHESLPTLIQHPLSGLFVVGEETVLPQHQVRAHFTDTSVFVYQAFRREIARPAVREQRFMPPFSRSRMTWIKPSFAWMMYRSGWCSKVGQEHVLRVEVSRRGFDWALSHSCLTSFDGSVHADRDEWKLSMRDCPVRVQWDPERTLLMETVPWRTIQVGIGPSASGMYVDDWVLGIEDFTHTSLEVREAVRRRDFGGIRELLPPERPYPVSAEAARRTRADTN